MSLYLESDPVNGFLVDASISYLLGQAYPSTSNWTIQISTKLVLHITAAGNGTADRLIKTASIDIDSVNNEVVTSLDQFTPSLIPYDITIKASDYFSNNTVYTATTQLTRLPQRKDGGNVTRLDNLDAIYYGRNISCFRCSPLLSYTHWD